VTSAGDTVLGDGGPIVFANTDRGITINADGTIRVQEGAQAIDGGRGRLRLASFANAQLLKKDGASTFLAPEGVQPEAPGVGVRLVQGSIEKSNVRPVVEMARMVELSRAYTEVAGLLQSQADLRRSSIEKLAEVPA
jgi:flagellar basal body rod protein FlgG